jgi:glycosyltransferase involved in cell wall biosynthesis
VSASQPQRRFRLLLGGPITAPAYHQEIVDLIAERGLEASVTLHPAVVSESALHRDLLTALDAFVLPSRHEPFGIVVLEAWASGLPVIVSQVGGLQKLVSHEQDGLHFPSGDAAALTAALARLAGDPEMGRSLAASGFSKMTRHYTWKAVNEQLEEIYQTAESRHRP